MKAVQGEYNEEFASLVEIFAAQGVKDNAGGSSLCVFKDGVAVVNIWQGDARQDQPWRAETVSNVFSCTKGIATVLVAMLVEKNLLQLDAKVAEYWPEFAAEGKEQVTLRQLLQHRAGLSAPRESISHAQAVDGHSVAEKLAQQAPLWQPGSSNAYHALTFGYLTAEIIRRVTGQTIGELLQTFISQPLQVAMWIGFRGNETTLAPLLSDGNFKSTNPVEFSDGYWLERAMTLGAAFEADPTSPNGFNNPATIAAEIAGANGITNAYGLAKMYSATVCDTDGVRLIRPQTVRDFCQPSPAGQNFWNEPEPFGKWAAGFMLPLAGVNEMPGKESFGHNGLGGQAGWASLDQRVGFGYTTTYLKNTPDTQLNQQSLVRELNKILAR